MFKSRISNEEWHKRFIHQSEWTITIRNYLFKKAFLQPESKILEVGSGTGAILSNIPDNRYIRYGLDIENSFLQFSKTHHPYLHHIQGDGHLIPIKPNVFDLIYCHYLLLWVKNPVSILKEFCRVGKPGAHVFIIAEPDYGGRIDYPPALENLGRAQIKSLTKQGADPFIGRKIKRIANVSGLRIIETGILGSQTNPESQSGFIESEWEMLKYDLADSFSGDELKQIQEEDLAAWQNNIRILFIPTFYLLGEIR